jgi:hypothetical protein
MCESTRGLLLGVEDVPVVGFPPMSYELCCTMTQRNFSPAHIRIASAMRLFFKPVFLPFLYLNVWVCCVLDLHLAGCV